MLTHDHKCRLCQTQDAFSFLTHSNKTNSFDINQFLSRKSSIYSKKRRTHESHIMKSMLTVVTRRLGFPHLLISSCQSLIFLKVGVLPVVQSVLPCPGFGGGGGGGAVRLECQSEVNRMDGVGPLESESLWATPFWFELFWLDESDGSLKEKANNKLILAGEAWCSIVWIICERENKSKLKDGWQEQQFHLFKCHSYQEHKLKVNCATTRW